MDSSGASTVTGWFEGMATFGAGEANETVLSSAGSSDVFVAQYDSAGLLKWARRDGGTGGELSVGIAVDSSGASTVTGGFQGMATFGAGEANETVLSSAGSSNVFVAKYQGMGGGRPPTMGCTVNGMGNQLCQGTGGDDTIVGTAGDDVIDGGDGDDVLKGSGGNDTLRGGDGDDALVGGAGNDMLSGGAGEDVLRGEGGDDTLEGGADADTLLGGAGQDTLSGGSGDDKLLGHQDDDSLDGGADTDYLDGGNGMDGCVNGETVVRCE